MTIHGTLCQAHPTTLHCHCWAPPDSTHPTHSQTTFPHWVQPRFPPAESQISPSIKPFIHSNTATAWACASEEGPHKDFYPFTAWAQGTKAQFWLFFLSPGLLPWLWVSLTQLCYRSSDPLACKGSQVTSPCPSELPELNLQLANQATCTRCVPQHKRKALWLGF